MRLLKYHGLGNDFLIFFDTDDAGPVGAAAVRAVCDRHRGVGADGFIRITAGPTMELTNADGSPAEISGNGLRCVARALADAGLADGGPANGGLGLVIETGAGPRRAWFEAGGAITVEMGTVTIAGAAGVWSTRGHDGHGDSGDSASGRALMVDVGNPHVVNEVVDVSVAHLAEAGAAHPDRNVEVVAAGPQSGALTMRVWERGVGETQSCGSGSVAAVAAARAWGIVAEGPVSVHQPGGLLTVVLEGGQARLTGPATYICAIDVPADDVGTTGVEA